MLPLKLPKPKQIINTIRIAQVISCQASAQQLQRRQLYSTMVILSPLESLQMQTVNLPGGSLLEMALKAPLFDRVGWQSLVVRTEVRSVYLKVPGANFCFYSWVSSLSQYHQ